LKNEITKTEDTNEALNETMKRLDREWEWGILYMLYNIMLCNITEHIIEFKIKTYSNDFLDDSFSSSLLNLYLSTYLYVLIRIKPILK